MGWPAVCAWRDRDRGALVDALAATPAKHRPDRRDVELVAMVHAMSIGPRGYSDLTVDQVIGRCGGALSAGQVNNAHRLLAACGELVTVKPSAPNRAPWRVLRCFDPVGLLQRCGADPATSSDPTQWGSGTNAVGLETQRNGASPAPLKGISKNSLRADAIAHDRRAFPGPPTSGRFAGSKNVAGDYDNILNDVTNRRGTLENVDRNALIDYLVAVRRGETISAALRRAIFPPTSCDNCDSTGLRTYDANGDLLPTPEPCPTCTNPQERKQA